MVYYPIGALVDAGIEDIMIVTGGQGAGKFLELLGDGSGFGLKRLQYGYQTNAGGIAEALNVAKDFVGGKKCVVMLGDNVFGESIKPYVEKFAGLNRGANVLLSKEFSPVDFGVADMDENGAITGIREKPEDLDARHGYVVTGCYMYDHQVWDIIPELERSGRGELEITDVNNEYLRRGQLFSDVVYEGSWADAGGSIYSLQDAWLLAERSNPLGGFALNGGP
jgi:glucose-1-phosphate thymidylyltransferase